MRFFERVSFNKWYSDVPIIGLQAEIARMWHHDIPDPIVDIKKGSVVFRSPYQVTIIPGNTCRIPTGFTARGAKEDWGEIFINIRNSNINPIEIGRRETLKEVITIDKIYVKLFKFVIIDGVLMGSSKCDKIIKKKLSTSSLPNSVFYR